MPLIVIAKAIVTGEELLIVVAETLMQPSDLGIATGVLLPESLHGLLVHLVPLLGQLACSLIVLPASW